MEYWCLLKVAEQEEDEEPASTAGDMSFCSTKQS